MSALLAPTVVTAERERPHLIDTTMFWSPAGGGVKRYLQDKRRWALDHGWRHSWVVSGECAPPDRRVAGIPLPASGGYRFPLQRRRAAQLLAALAPDVIEAGDPYRLAWSALDAASACGVPCVTFCHSNIVAEAQHRLGRATATAVRLYLRRLLAHFDAVFAASRWMVDELRDLGLDNLVQQPLGVDIERFNPGFRDPAWRQRLAIPADAIVLTYVGRFSSEKNLDDLVELVDRLGDSYLLVLQGAGPRVPRGERVRVLPYSAEPGAVATTLANADVFVHAGRRETFGLAPLEALACGTPVVMPRCAGLAELCDGRAAIGVDGDVAAFAEAVRGLHEQSRDALRQFAVEAAREFDQRRTFPRLFERYAALSSTQTMHKQVGGLRLA
jgi:alpha-1,6-mannosyltransferase